MNQPGVYDYERDIVPIMEAKADALGKLAGTEDILRMVHDELTSLALYQNRPLSGLRK